MGKKGVAEKKSDSAKRAQSVSRVGPPCTFCGAGSRRLRPKLYRCERGHSFAHKWR